MAKKNNYSENTIRTYLSILNQYNKDYKDIRLIKKKILSHSESPNTCILHYNVLLAYMKWNKDKRISLLKTLKLPKTPTVYRDVFSKEYLMQKTGITKMIVNFL